MTKEKFYRSINLAVSVLMRKNNNRGVIFGGKNVWMNYFLIYFSNYKLDKQMYKG